MVGAIGFEPTTPTMSRWCSNQLSYAPEAVAKIRETIGQSQSVTALYSPPAPSEPGREYSQPLQIRDFGHVRTSVSQAF